LETYPQDIFAKLAQLEDGHFWFEERNNLISWAIKKYAPDCRNLLEVGCGTGFVLQRLAQDFPNAKITGLEYYPEALPIAQRRCPRAQLGQADIMDLSYDAEFDVIGCFDVLEHIPDDLAALHNLRKAMRSGATLFITVPQHMWLWSDEDTHAMHQRRYTRKELLSRAAAAGLRLFLISSYVSLPVPLMLLRKWRSSPNAAAKGLNLAEFQLPPMVNSTLRGVLSLERAAIKAGVSWPVGGSLFAGFRTA
jgi:SAM-dependent methyltransferase